MLEVFVFEAELVDHPGVSRRLALPANDTLHSLHELLRLAFEWHDDHLYSFWLDGEFWGGPDSEYTSPFEGEGMDSRSADVRLDRLELEVGRQIAYVFDYGDEWRVLLTLVETAAGREAVPLVLARHGEAPPQYERLDELDLGYGD